MGSVQQHIKKIEAPILYSTRASFAQQRLWFLEKLTPADAAYHISAAIHLEGELKLDVLQQVMDEIVIRHDSLRTTFTEEEGEPLQVIHDSFSIPIVELDISHFDHPMEEAKRRSYNDVLRPFDLKNGPLLRMEMLKLEDANHVFIISMHHIISDGWSISVLINEMSQLYKDFLSGQESSLSELDIQYADYSDWQAEYLEEGVEEKEVNYWKSKLDDCPTLIGLPTDRPRPPVQTHHGRKLALSWDTDLHQKILNLCKSESTTAFMFLLAAFKTVLSRFSGDLHICVGTPNANRQQEESRNLIGFFVNTLVLRTQLDDNPTFLEILKRVRATSLEAFDHQELPFERLVEVLQPTRNTSHTPLFQVIFTLQNNLPAELALEGLKCEILEPDLSIAKFDVALSLTESEQGLQGYFEYNTDLFNDASANRIIDALDHIIKQAITNPEIRLFEFELTETRKLKQIISNWNQTQKPYPSQQTIQSLFEAQVEKAPDAPAIVINGHAVSYQELNERANQIAHMLLDTDLPQESFIGVSVDRCAEFFSTILGILKAGHVYLPLDPEYPQDRLEFMANDAKIGCLFTQTQFQDKWQNQPFLQYCVDQIELSKWPTNNPSPVINPEQLAYVIYTSGSTGRPKGVMIAHRNLCNLATALIDHFHISDQTKYLQFASYSFDASVSDIFINLLAGGQLHVTDNETLKSPESIEKFINQQNLTTATLPPSVAQWIDPNNVPSLEVLITAGEACPAELANRWVDRTFINAYGPTENTVCASCCEISEPLDLAPSIGPPIYNVQLYVLDNHLNLLPPGIPGELHIGGSSLARGYLERPDLTAEKFIPDPFSDNSGTRLYKTGDLARWNDNGEVEFLGRIDHQVKIRGFRIEIGEIESQLSTHDDINGSIVMDKKAPNGEIYLVAWVASRNPDLSSDQLREYLGRTLTDYMIPSAFVILDSFPLTPNGKIDRKALPAPEGVLGETTYIAPRNESEITLQSIWGEILNIENIGINDNFFELGGHSLLATQLLSKVQKNLNADIKLKDFFSAPTIRNLAELIESAENSISIPKIDHIDRSKPIPLSYAQQRLWFLYQYESDSSAYNMPSALRLQGQLDTKALTRAINTLIERHESLRTVFKSGFKNEDNTAYQVILDKITVDLTPLDISSENNPEASAINIAEEDANTLFDLEKGPLFTAKLLKLGNEDHVVLLNMHHIISDGWSIAIMLRELTTLYNSFKENRGNPLTEVSFQYADFAVWQQQWLSGEKLEQQLDYWRTELTGAPALLELPTDRPRPAEQTYTGDNFRFSWPKTTLDSLNQLCQTHDATLFMGLSTCLNIILYRLSGQNDISIGSPIANRNHADIESIVGFFVNTLVLRNEVNSHDSFISILDRVRSNTLDAYAHQDLPFEHLVDAINPERDLSYSPLFQVMLVLQNVTKQGIDLEGLECNFLTRDNTTAKFDLTFNFFEDENELLGLIEYNTDLFDRRTIARFADHFEQLVETLIHHPDRELRVIDLLNESQRQQILIDWNQTQSDFPCDSLPALFEQQVEIYGDRDAIVFGDCTLSYLQLNAKANQWAHYLIEQGVKPDQLVGLCIDRSMDLLVVILGILKAGGAYLPIDPDYPEDRINYMLDTAVAPLLLVQPGLLEFSSSDTTTVIDISDITLDKYPETNLSVATGPDNLAYVNFTSGSTGLPKGIAIPQKAVTRLVRNTNYVEYDENDTLGQIANASFDAFTFELWGAWLNGGRVCIIPKVAEMLPEEFAEVLEKQKVTVMFMTSALFTYYAQKLPTAFKHMKTLSVGGDKVDPHAIQSVLKAASPQRILNGYGPTENTTFSTWYPLHTLEDSAITCPIGYPIGNSTCYVLDPDLNPVPVGVIGELHVGGAGLARGYLNRPDLTADKFIPNPFSDDSGDRLYKTGDLVRYRLPTDKEDDSGVLEFMGRVDNQVKVRGFRIELGEIETQLNELESVAAATVIVREDQPGDKRIVAYLIAQSDEITVVELREQLSDVLPDFMVPSAFVWLDEFPLTPNGKVNRKALPAPDGNADLGNTFVAPRNPTEQQIADIWADVLGLESVGIHDNFFALGGDSILSIQLVSKARQLGLEITVKMTFQHQTVASLAGAIGSAQTLFTEQGLLSGESPLLPIQHWFFEQQIPNREHWNQSIILSCREKLELDFVEKAYQALLDQHDAIRLSFSSNKDRSAIYLETPKQLIETCHISKSLETADDEILEFTERLQRSLNIESGPLMACGLINTADKDLLFITIHHLAVDGVSWRIILEDLHTLFEQYSNNQELKLPPKSSSSRAFTERLQQWAQQDKNEKALDYWLHHSANINDSLPLDINNEDNRVSETLTLSEGLSEELTEQLLTQAHTPYNTQINDLLLCALAKTFYEWTGNNSLVIAMEGHGRESLFDDIDLSRTVGWFTNMLPVRLELEKSQSLADQILTIKEILHTIPNNGLGYGCLRYLNQATSHHLADAIDPPISFNYLGQFDTVFDDDAIFSMAKKPRGTEQDPDSTRANLIDISGSVFQRKLSFSWRYSKHLHQEKTIAKLAKRFMENLEAVITHCVETKEQRLSPSDFPLASITQHQLDKLVEHNPKLNDIYPLSAMQQGMLYHSLLEPEEGHYCQQMWFHLDGEVNEEALPKAWQQVIDRHESFRTAFINDFDIPLQLVIKEVVLPYSFEDSIELDDNQFDTRLSEYIETDKRRYFNMAQPPLMRVHLFKRSNSQYTMVWTYHHILLDGWCLSKVFTDFLHAYEQLSKGEKLNLGDTPPAFKNYIEWLNQQDKQATDNYWKKYLEGFAVATPLPAATKTNQTGPAQSLFRLSEETSETVSNFVRDHEITANTFFQGAFALLLSQYSGHKDIVFGMTVSGRPAELSGSDDMVGLFINTIPMRIQTNSEETVAKWLQNIQQQQMESRQHEHSLLTEIQAVSEIPNNSSLFETLFVFENFPIDEEMEGAKAALPIASVGTAGSTNFPLTWVMAPGKSFVCSIKSNRSLYSDAIIENLFRQFESIIEKLIEKPVTKSVATATLSSPLAQTHIDQMLQWNETAQPHNTETTLVERFEDIKSQHPEQSALKDEENMLTFAELDQASNQLANYLCKQGISHENRVAICLDRGIDQHIAIWAVLKTGACFIPVDPEYPSERISYLLEDSDAKALITHEQTQTVLDGITDSSISCPVISLTNIKTEIESESTQFTTPLVTPDSAAYIIYTSGSTGRPKGTVVTHRSVVHLHEALSRLIYQTEEKLTIGINASYAFDASVKQWVQILSGHTLMPIPQDIRLDTEELYRFIQTHQIGALDITPQQLRLIMESSSNALETKALESSVPTCLKRVLIGGEAIPDSLWKTLGKDNSQCRFFNVYGPTECTVDATIQEILPEYPVATIGQAIDNYQIHIVNDHLESLPIGGVGEIAIGGIGLARGYLARPDQTASVFLPDPFTQTPGKRIYLTGDLGSFNSDGTVNYIGRKDFQVKIRGYRIELEEIEYAIAQIENITDSLVIVTTNPSGEAELVGYAVMPSTQIEVREIKSSLRKYLPDYMIPAHLITLHAFPLTPNGKIDRKALPQPVLNALDSDFVAPEGPIQQLIADIWRDVLNLDQISVHANFHEIGGHSLNATQIVSRIRKQLETQLSLREFFEKPTVALLAKQLEQTQSENQNTPAITKVDRDNLKEKKLSLSYAQQRLWFLDQFEPGQTIYNMPAAVRLLGHLNIEQLQQALQFVVDRHESLRTTFACEESSSLENSSLESLPYQVIEQTVKVDLSLTTINEADIENIIAQDAGHIFNLNQGPLFRFKLYQIEENCHLLTVNLHHIISDGWSNGILIRELSQVYDQLSRDESPSLPPLSIQYADFAHWQRQWLQGETLDTQIEYWRNHLADAPELITLPTDFPRPAIQSFEGDSVEFSFPSSLTRKLRQLSNEQGTTLFMTLLGLYKILLSRYSGQNDIVVGIPIANRHHAEIEPVIGFFINTLVLRTQLGSHHTVADLLQQIRKNSLDAYAYQDLPFEQLVEALNPNRNLSYSPLFQVMFNMQNTPKGRLKLQDVELEPVELSQHRTKFDLSLNFVESDDSLRGGIIYNRSLFKRDTIEQFIAHLEHTAKLMCQRPQQLLAEICLLNKEEIQQAVTLNNQTQAAYASNKCIHETIAEQAQTSPENTAIVCGDQSITYKELDQQANQIAHQLINIGAKPNNRVALLSERSIEQIIGLIGILKAGATYLPIDPIYPDERIQHMLSDSDTCCILTSKSCYSRVSDQSIEVIQFNNVIANLDIPTTAPETNLYNKVCADDLTYTIYTSGSTGLPKAASVFHRSVSNHIDWYIKTCQFTVNDRIMVFSSIGFDLTQRNILAPLAAGAELHLYDDDYYDPESIGKQIESHQISFFCCAPSALYPLLDLSNSEKLFASLRMICVGGEAIEIQRLNHPAILKGPINVLNAFGPTEATATCTAYPISVDDIRNDRKAPIGKPIQNVRVYLLDQAYNHVPKGVVGQIFAAGAGIGIGYHNRPDLTAEVFLPDPFSSEPGSRMYATGDLGRYLPDGNIDYLGRADFQVKIRGMRIELSEVEIAIRNAKIFDENKGFNNVLVTVSDDKLVSYLETDANIDLAKLRNSLADQLPEHMIPSAFVILDKFPLSANGKIDRKALPEPDASHYLSDHYVAPRTGTEEILVQIFEDLLSHCSVDLIGIGINDNFFDIGGHSLLATQLATRIRQAFDIDFNLRSIFEHPTIAQIAEQIETCRDGQQEQTPIERTDRNQPIPLSFAQQRLWFLEQLTPGQSTYHMPSALRIKGSLNVDAFTSALKQLVIRHESLRTGFTQTDPATQFIVDDVAFDVPFSDLSNGSNLQETSQQQLIDQLIHDTFTQPFDLNCPPLIRCHIIYRGDEEYLFLLNMHHIITDGWSTGVLLRELSILYGAAVENETIELPELICQYADFAAWQRNWLSGERLQQQIDFWHQQLGDAPALLELPTDFTRPAIQTHRGASTQFLWDKELSEQFKQLTRQNSATLFMSLLALFNLLLSRYSRQNDLCVGTAIANRTREEVEPMIGFFVNTLVLRTQIETDKPFGELINAIRLSSLNAYAHQDLPFEHLVEVLNPVRNPSHSPLFQVMFNLQNAPQSELQLKGLDVSRFISDANDAGVAKFDLTLNCMESPDGIVGRFTYNVDLFKPETIERMASHFEQLARAIIENAKTPLHNLKLISTDETLRITNEWNQTQKPVEDTLPTHQLFEKVAFKFASQIAVDDNGTSITYRELNNRANQLAHYLLANGIQPEESIGVSLHRCADFVISILAIMKAGGCYLPLDPDYPRDRLDFMIEDARVKQILCHQQHQQIWSDHQNLQITLLDQIQLDGESETAPELTISADQLAYIIYTSGSTGKPKGTALAHRGLNNLAAAQIDGFVIDSNTHLLQFASFNFDASVSEIFTTLLAGGTLCLADSQKLKDLSELINTLNQMQVTHVTLPPSLAMLLEPGQISTLKTLVTAGEACPQELANSWQDKLRFINAYGPTESTVCATMNPITTQLSNVPSIGNPIQNIKTYIVDNQMQLLPAGIPGEILIGGIGLARGYLNRTDLTAEKFIPNPFAEQPGERLYRSGDLGRWNEKGEIEFLGRIDHQVKVRGFRIELGEIENALTTHEYVSGALVTVLNGNNGDKQLIGYVQCGESSIGSEELKTYLNAALPEYMIPATIMVMDKFPLNASGKIDRKALPEPVFSTNETELVAPANPTEEKLREIWLDLLPVSALGVQQNFFHLGGHSLLATRLVSRVQEAFSIDLPLQSIFDHPTIQGLGEQVDIMLWTINNNSSVDADECGDFEEFGEL